MSKILARVTRRECTDIPYWCKLYIVLHGDSRYLYMTSRIHVNRLVKCGVSYSSTFNRSILNDTSCIEFINRFK